MILAAASQAIWLNSSNSTQFLCCSKTYYIFGKRIIIYDILGDQYQQNKVELFQILKKSCYNIHIMYVDSNSSSITKMPPEKPEGVLHILIWYGFFFCSKPSCFHAVLLWLYFLVRWKVSTHHEEVPIFSSCTLKCV